MIQKISGWRKMFVFIYRFCNSIDNEVIGLINHCEFVKELMDYLEFLYSGKGNVLRIFEVCKAFHRLEK